jgi:short-subunit dehydrogenase
MYAILAISKMKTVWITGGGSGIGKALALSFATDGWDVVISGRTKLRLEEVQSLSSKIRVVACDITKKTEIQAALKAIGQIDVAILNAGDYKPEPTNKISITSHMNIFGVNYFGTLQCIQAIMPEMKKKGGSLAIVASLAGYRGLPNASAYGTSKAALIHLAESLRAELQNTRLKVQLINPGFVKSTLTEKNSFDMPFIMKAEDAAKKIRAGLESDKFEIAFPSPLVRRMKLLRMLPYSLFFHLTKKMI